MGSISFQVTSIYRLGYKDLKKLQEEFALLMKEPPKVRVSGPSAGCTPGNCCECLLKFRPFVPLRYLQFLRIVRFTSQQRYNTHHIVIIRWAQKTPFLHFCESFRRLATSRFHRFSDVDTVFYLSVTDSRERNSLFVFLNTCSIIFRFPISTLVFALSVRFWNAPRFEYVPNGV